MLYLAEYVQVCKLLRSPLWNFDDASHDEFTRVSQYWGKRQAQGGIKQRLFPPIEFRLSLVFATVFVSLSSLALSTLLAVSATSAQCINPTVRKEWRALTKAEKITWISAIQCINSLLHNPNLTQTVDPSLSLIPAMNTSGNFWDDISFMHMDLNIKIHETGMFLRSSLLFILWNRR
ncbi:hypothetical protein BT96DRAFT_340944 [Gymnopus androsaceus JB14]|uniref:Uncharacterized protein n=1 Tax=Gymnopus androsaceus JB14 TaxID=1447944 RepID=A0A6A4GZ28_9AGAR|nr:hypothetical protein BT96DRAFT_340944 [Gymnopus androsaceus JB14]